MDTQYKAKGLATLDPISPVVGGLAPMTPLRWSPVGAAMRAQDTIPATSRRIVAQWSLSSAEGWAQPSGAANPGTTPVPVSSQVYPDGSWRRLGVFFANVTPGCELRSYAVHSLAGLVQKTVPLVGGGNLASDGAWAEVRVGVTWTNGVSTTGPHYRTSSMAGSPTGTYTGGELDGPGQEWSAMQVTPTARHVPPGYLDDPMVAAAYSEWSSAEIELEIRGGARVVEIVVYEHPISHVTDHDDDGITSVHAMPATQAPLTPGPLTKAPDGPTYEEHRFGSRRLAQVAERQSERLGPRIMHWSAWDEDESAIWEQSEGTPRVRSSTSLVHLLTGVASTTYSLQTPGWVVAGAHAQLARLCDPVLIGRGAIGAVPVRVRVDASRATANGTVRVQCGRYDWVDVTVTGGRAIYTRTGYLETQLHPDDASWPLVVWISAAAGGTLSVYSVSVDFGTWVA